MLKSHAEPTEIPSSLERTAKAEILLHMFGFFFRFSQVFAPEFNLALQNARGLQSLFLANLPGNS